jgi:hypothetical protein
MVQGLCELNEANPADHTPDNPEDFFNRVGPREWFMLDTKYTGTEHAQ